MGAFDWSMSAADAAHMRGSVGLVTVLIIVSVVLVVIILVLDLSCYFLNGCGLTMFLCVHVCGKDLQKDGGSEDEDAEESQNMLKQPRDGEVKLNIEKDFNDSGALENVTSRLLAEEPPTAADNDCLRHDDNKEEEELKQPVSNRRSVLSQGDERWKDVVEELEQQLSQKKSQQEPTTDTAIQDVKSSTEESTAHLEESIENDHVVDLDDLENDHMIPEDVESAHDYEALIDIEKQKEEQDKPEVVLKGHEQNQPEEVMKEQEQVQPEVELKAEEQKQTKPEVEHVEQEQVKPETEREELVQNKQELEVIEQEQEAPHHSESVDNRSSLSAPSGDWPGGRQEGGDGPGKEEGGETNYLLKRSGDNDDDPETGREISGEKEEESPGDCDEKKPLIKLTDEQDSHSPTTTDAGLNTKSSYEGEENVLPEDD